MVGAMSPRINGRIDRISSRDNVVIVTAVGAGLRDTPVQIADSGLLSDDDGVLTHTLTWTVTESLTIGVFDSIPGTDYEDYWFSSTQIFVVDGPAPVDGAQSTIEVTPTTVVADGVEAAVIVEIIGARVVLCRAYKGTVSV